MTAEEIKHAASELAQALPINDPQVSINANWVLTIVVAIVGFFLVRTLNKMEKAIETQGNRIADLETTTALHTQKMEAMEEEYHPSKIAEIIWVKLKAMNG